MPRVHHAAVLAVGLAVSIAQAQVSKVAYTTADGE